MIISAHSTHIKITKCHTGEIAGTVPLVAVYQIEQHIGPVEYSRLTEKPVKM